MERRGNITKKQLKSVKNEEMIEKTKKILTEIAQELKDEEYNLVIENLAELINNKVYDAEAMYAGAYSYFMLGDYKRAVDWINNTLSYNPEHLQVRVLLGHLCLLNDRVDNAMALYEYVLKHGRNTLDEAILEEITSVGKGYAGQKAQGIEKDYPEIAKLIGNIDCSDEKMICEHQIDDMQKEMNNDVINICHKIMMEDQSLEHKLEMLNKFAGGFYLNSQLHEAENLLLAALKIDNTSEMTLRNLFMVQIGLGCKEKAERIAAEMSAPDFVLLKMIQSC